MFVLLFVRSFVIVLNEALAKIKTSAILSGDSSELFTFLLVMDLSHTIKGKTDFIASHRLCFPLQMGACLLVTLKPNLKTAALQGR